jgi:hypothetical protein
VINVKLNTDVYKPAEKVIKYTNGLNIYSSQIKNTK